MAECYPRKLSRHSAPLAEPLSLAEVKLYLRVDHAEEDSLIAGLIMAARQSAEDYLRRSIALQEWKLGFSIGLPEVVALPMAPVQSIISVQKLDAEGNAETVVSSAYVFDAVRAELRPLQSICAHKVEIIFAAGYATSGDIPESLRQGMLAHVAALYDGRSEAQVPEVTRSLYAPYREVSL